MVVNKQEKRAYLDRWASEDHHGDAEGMAREHPWCACEGASSTENGHGPILDDERLRCFVVSWIDVDLSKGSQKRLNSSVVSNIFKKGKSAVRIDKADAAEKVLTASIIHKKLAAQKPQFGGVLGVIDFTAERVRYFENGERACCVFDTPYHPYRPSHVDLVFAAGQKPQDEEVARKVREEIFNRMGGAGAFVHSAEVADCDLSQFLPEIIKPEHIG